MRAPSCSSLPHSVLYPLIGLTYFTNVARLVGLVGKRNLRLDPPRTVCSLSTWFDILFSSHNVHATMYKPFALTFLRSALSPQAPLGPQRAYPECFAKRDSTYPIDVDCPPTLARVSPLAPSLLRRHLNKSPRTHVHAPPGYCPPPPPCAQTLAQPLQARLIHVPIYTGTIHKVMSEMTSVPQ